MRMGWSDIDALFVTSTLLNYTLTLDLDLIPSQAKLGDRMVPSHSSGPGLIPGSVLRVFKQHV